MIRLVIERRKRGLTQVKLSALTGIAPQDISRVENGRRPAFPGWRKRIARALGIQDADWLFEEVSDGEVGAIR